MPRDEESIFAAALAIPDPRDRAAYLDRACAGEPALRAGVDALLAAYPAGSFLEAPADPPPPGPTAEYVARTSAPGTRADAAPRPAGPAAGSRVGPYKLLEVIGEGGMGTVWLADQAEPVRRKVALKVIKPGMDSKQVLARFEAERQALALMDHPNIATVLDAGATADGRPYFVMELVKGTPITAYCDEHRLPPRDRLALFADVCRAVQHAHQKGVVHRDLKPSNVLVGLYDAEPVVKVIDFGVAKAAGQPLTDRTLFTGFGAVVGTPEYMSPEQATLDNLDVDTRSDVYALGVLLYELLTGTTPLTRETARRAALLEVLRLVREADPPRPSARLSGTASRAEVAAARGTDPGRLARLLRGELDWVVMRCLEKDRDRRYGSAAALADDVRRYLADEPVEACPPSAVYRARKFARRHRGPVAAAAVALLAVVAGAGVSAWKYADERAARREAAGNLALAERHAADARRQAAEAEAARAAADRERDAVALNLYRADARLGLADHAAGNLGRLTRTLLGHARAAGREDPRGWEWFYLLGLAHRAERTLADVQAAATGVGWSPDGRHLAAAGDDATLRVWEAATGRLVCTFYRSNQLKRGVAWSPDGRWLAWTAVAPDNAVYLWRVGTDEVRDLRGHASSAWAVAWSPDGGRLASAGIDRTVRIWDPAAGTLLATWTGPGPNIGAVGWSPDGTRVAAAGQNGWRVWDAASGRVVREGNDRNLVGAVAWHPAGDRLAVGTGAGECLLVRPGDRSEPARWAAHKGEVSGLAWSPDGARLASGGADNLVRVWDPAAGACTDTLRGHLGPVMAVAWDPPGGRVASAGLDGAVKVWTLPAAPEPRRLAPARPGSEVTIGWGDGGDTLHVFHPGGGWAAAWEAATGTPRDLVAVPRGPYGRAAPDGRVVVVGVGGPQERMAVHDVRSGETVRFTAAWEPWVPRLSPDGCRVAVPGGVFPATGVAVHEVGRDEPLFRADLYHPWAAAWSPDGRRLAVAGSGQPSDGGALQHAGWLHVFDPTAGRRVLKVRIGTTRRRGKAVAWSPDGARVVAGNEDGLAEVFDATTGRRLASAAVHTAMLTALAWSPDGRRVASGGADRTVRVWDPDGGAELLRLDTPEAGVREVVWSPDGRRLAATGEDGGVWVWDATPGYRYAAGDEFAREQARAQLAEAAGLAARGRAAEALALRERAAAELTRLLGPSHDEVLRAAYALGAAYRAAGRPDEAAVVLEAAADRWRAAAGPWASQRAYALAEAARAHQQAGRLADADRLLREVLAIHRAQPSPYAERVSAAEAELGGNLLRQGRHAEAEPVLRSCLATREKEYPDDWTRFNAQSLLGEALLGQGRHAAAEPLLVSGYDGLATRAGLLPPDGSHRADAAARLARLYEATGRADQVAAWRARAAGSGGGK